MSCCFSRAQIYESKIIELVFWRTLTFLKYIHLLHKAVFNYSQGTVILQFQDSKITFSRTIFQKIVLLDINKCTK